MTNDKKQPGLPVVEVDQAFPLMTTDGVSRPATSTGMTGDQGPAVSAAIRDVLGWRPRVQDPKAFTAALSAAFDLSIVEDHVVARHVPRGVAVQADLGGVTGGQASLYLRAKAAHEQITRMLDSLKPLRTDADPEDCEAYRGLVRDSVRRIVMELGREGGPRVPLVDSAFSVLTGYQPSPSTPLPSTGKPRGFTAGPVTGLGPTLSARFAPSSSFAISGQQVAKGSVPAAVAEIDPDSVPGQLGALRDRFGLDDDHVNTVDEEKQRTSFWTLVELITDLQRSWDLRRLDFTLGAGNGFLGTDLVQISRLLAAAAEQVDEFEAVLDSVLVSAAERQTVVLDLNSGLTLDDLVQWLRVFFTEDGPNIIRDTGRDGLVSSFSPTAVALLLTLREKLVRTLVPCAGPGCAGGCTCGCRGLITCIPLGCSTKLPPGMYSGRVKIAVSTLCGLVERLTRKAIRIGRFAGAVLLDLAVVPFQNGTDFVRVEVRGLRLRPTYVPAFIADGGDPADPAALVLPLQGSASADADSLSGIFQRSALPAPLLNLLSLTRTSGIVMAASEVPLAIVDGELGRIAQGPAVTTWPRLQPAGVVAGDGGPDVWDEFPPNQRFVPQSPPNPVDPTVADDCLPDCADGCEGCDCACHEAEGAKADEEAQPLDVEDGSPTETDSQHVDDEDVAEDANGVNTDFDNRVSQEVLVEPESAVDPSSDDLLAALRQLCERVAGHGGNLQARTEPEQEAELTRQEVLVEPESAVDPSSDDLLAALRQLCERVAGHGGNLQARTEPEQEAELTRQEVLVEPESAVDPSSDDLLAALRQLCERVAGHGGNLQARTEPEQEAELTRQEVLVEPESAVDPSSDDLLAALRQLCERVAGHGGNLQARTEPEQEAELTRQEVLVEPESAVDPSSDDLLAALRQLCERVAGHGGNLQARTEPEQEAELTRQEVLVEPELAVDPSSDDLLAALRQLCERVAGHGGNLQARTEPEQEAELTRQEVLVEPELAVYPRSELEQSTLDGLRALVAEQSGKLESRVKRIQDSPQIRKFVVAALRAPERARAAGHDGDSHG